MTTLATTAGEDGLGHVRGLLAIVIEDVRVPAEPALDALAAFNELDLDGALPAFHRPDLPVDARPALTFARDLCLDLLTTLSAQQCLAVGRAVRHIDRALEALDA